MVITPSDLRPDYPEQWNGWVACPRPRRLRLKQHYRFWVAFLASTLVIVPATVIGFLALEWRAHPPGKAFKSDFWNALPFVVLPIIVLLLILWILKRDRRMMSHGEISIGKVTRVRRGRRGTPIVTCEFLDRSGRLISVSARDSTRSFAQGMAIPIFYDTGDPEGEHVALCETAYEIVERAGF